MKNFSVRSAWTTFQWMLLTNRRQLLVYLAGFTVAAFALDEFCLMKFSNILEDGRVVEPAAWGLGFMPYFYIWAMSLWMVYGASRTFVFAKNRQSAITLPRF